MYMKIYMEYAFHNCINSKYIDIFKFKDILKDPLITIFLKSYIL